MLIVFVHPYCAQKFIGQMAIAKALPGLKDLWWPLFFFFMDQFLYLFSTFSEEMMKICWLEVPIFGKKHHWILFFLAPRLSLWQFQMPLERLSFMKTLATLGIINASDSIVPDITRIVYLCWYMFNILWTLETMLIYTHQIIKIRIFYTGIISEPRSVTIHSEFIICLQ